MSEPESNDPLEMLRRLSAPRPKYEVPHEPDPLEELSKIVFNTPPDAKLEELLTRAVREFESGEMPLLPAVSVSIPDEPPLSPDHPILKSLRAMHKLG